MEKDLEKLVDQWLKETQLEEPSADFSSKVMHKIEALEDKKSIAYKPIIHKGILGVIFLAIIAGITTVFSKEPLRYPNWFQALDFDFLEFGVSQTILYAFVFLAAMFMIQVFVLKSYFEKRMV